MAATFDGSTSKLVSTTTPVTSFPCTLVAWFKTRSNAADQVVASVDDNNTGANIDSFELQLDHLNGVVAARRVAGGFSGATATGGVPANNAWEHYGGVYASATSIAAYRNGASKGTAAPSGTPTAFTTIRVGQDGAAGEFANGTVAHVALWSDALTDGEMYAIGGLGVSPLYVRPQSLVWYSLVPGYPPGKNLAPKFGASTHYAVPTAVAAAMDAPRIPLLTKRRLAGILASTFIARPEMRAMQAVNRAASY